MSLTFLVPDNFLSSSDTYLRGVKDIIITFMLLCVHYLKLSRKSFVLIMLIMVVLMAGTTRMGVRERWSVCSVCVVCV